MLTLWIIYRYYIYVWWDECTLKRADYISENSKPEKMLNNDNKCYLPDFSTAPFLWEITSRTLCIYYVPIMNNCFFDPIWVIVSVYIALWQRVIIIFLFYGQLLLMLRILQHTDETTTTTTKQKLQRKESTYE